MAFFPAKDTALAYTQLSEVLAFAGLSTDHFNAIVMQGGQVFLDLINRASVLYPFFV